MCYPQAYKLWTLQLKITVVVAGDQTLITSNISSHEFKTEADVGCLRCSFTADLELAQTVQVVRTELPGNNITKAGTLDAV